MSSDRIAISVKNVSKDFNLPHLKTNSIKDIFVHPLRVFGNAKKVEAQHALKDISFDIKEGEFFGIVGRNGSGKSTLLKIIAEIYQPTKGEVSVAGRLVPFIELGVGFNPELTGRENVYLSCALNGFSTAEVDAMYDDIVEFAELGEFMDQKLKNYSSGMQVRLAFSVATRSNADVLLIDEVLAVGDADFQRKCFEYFNQLKHDGVTVVFVSHDMDAIRKFCTSALLIDNNQVVAIGSPDDISLKYSELFTDEEVAHLTHSTEAGVREGSGTVSISNPKAEVTRSTIKISYNLRSKNDTREIVTGFRIRTLSGKDVLGSSNQILGKSIKTSNGNKDDKISWTLPNLLSDGTYILDISVHNSSVEKVYDWWGEALRFNVKKPNRNPYDVDPELELMVE